MSSPQRHNRPGVIGRLLAEPHRFQFFQAMRVLRSYFIRRNGPEEASLETGAIRCRNSLSLNFPPSELEDIQADEHPRDTAAIDKPAFAELDRVNLTIAFLGLTGNQGTLPYHYTEQLLEREILHRDRAARAFLDIFTDRAATLFFRAWEKYRLHIQYETDRRERFLPHVLALAGFGSSGLQHQLHDGRAGVLDETLAYYAGLLRTAPRSPQLIAQVVGDHFQVPVRLTQFVGKWFELAPEQCTRLGTAEATLGVTACCGTRVWQRDARLRLEIGPLRKRGFDSFLPGEEGAIALKRLLHVLGGPTLEYQVRLILVKEDVEPLALDSNHSATGRLGRDGWLMSRPSEADSTDATYLIGYDYPASETIH